MSGARPRAVLLIANSAAPYSRGLRVARSLADAGYEVEIAATSRIGQPVEERDGPMLTRRHRPTGRWAGWAVDATGGEPSMRRMPLGRIGRFVRRGLRPVLTALGWPAHVRGWWATLRGDAGVAPADLYHAFGILTVPVALELARAARRAGRGGRVIYDVIDVILESNNYDDVPAPLVRWYRWRERRWVRRADAIVTVNQPIADHLARSWRLRTPPTVLLNCQPRWDVPDVRPDLIRAATGIPPERSIVLFLGRLGRERGLEEAAEAVLRLEDAALVMLGFGAWADRLRARDAEPRFRGRHYTLPPVHPDDVPAWTASADVSVIAVPALSLNQRLSTPNKFWESLTAGTPVVLGRDLEVMRAIVEADRLGAIADPGDPGDLARGLREILEAPPAEREAMRRRCLAVTRVRYNWEAAVVPYLDLVRGLGTP
ncbi:MAG: glycosyltransferase family 4 protein, partial [Chloroflexi bacterium]|nr:glycosyltransferase family 4 protein [Chloroflexota bacterium]